MNLRRTGLLSVVLLVTLFLATSAPALAQDIAAIAAPAPAPAQPTSLIGTILQVLVPVLSAWLMYVANRVIKAFETKTGMAVSEKQREQFNEALDQAVAYAAEQAHKAGENKLQGHQKLKAATEFANDAIKRFGLKEVAEDKLKAAIEAKVAVHRKLSDRPD